MSQLAEFGITTGVLYESSTPRHLRTVITALHDICDEVSFRCKKDGIFICEYPPAGDIVINVHINPSALEQTYEMVNGEMFILTFDTSQILKYMTVLQNDLPFIMYYDFYNSNVPCLNITSRDASGSHTGAGKVAIMNETMNDEMDVQCPSLMRVELPATEFLNLVNHMTTIGGNQGKMEIRLSIGDDGADYVEIEAFDETNQTNGWVERFNSVVTNLTACEKLDQVDETPIIDSNEDMCDEKSYELISRQHDARPAKRRKFERYDDGVDPIIFKQQYRLNHLKSIGKIAAIVSTVEFVFLKHESGKLIFTIQMEVPNLGKVNIVLNELAVDV